MLQPTLLRHLLVDAHSHPRGQAHLSAASGLVQVGAWLFVVADDEHHIGMLQAERREPVRLLRILPGDLPHDTSLRKKHKPDLEALAYVPANHNQPHGALLALGSGSKPNRQQAFVVEMDAAGELKHTIHTIDLTALYEPLHAAFGRLNIEGAFPVGHHFRLLQRGNKGDKRNASIDYELLDMQEWIAGKRNAPPVARAVIDYALGEIDGVPFGFTDGAALPDGGWVFCAAAEDTNDSYLDGRCAGSAIGWVGADGKLQRMERIEGSPKVEGIAVGVDGKLLLVTDSDDPAIASALLSLTPA